MTTKLKRNIVISIIILIIATVIYTANIYTKAVKNIIGGDAISSPYLLFTSYSLAQFRSDYTNKNQDTFINKILIKVHNYTHNIIINKVPNNDSEHFAEMFWHNIVPFYENNEWLKNNEDLLIATFQGLGNNKAKNKWINGCYRFRIMEAITAVLYKKNSNNLSKIASASYNAMKDADFQEMLKQRECKSAALSLPFFYKDIRAKEILEYARVNSKNHLDCSRPKIKEYIDFNKIINNERKKALVQIVWHHKMKGHDSSLAMMLDERISTYCTSDL